MTLKITGNNIIADSDIVTYISPSDSSTGVLFPSTDVLGYANSNAMSFVVGGFEAVRIENNQAFAQNPGSLRFNGQQYPSYPLTAIGPIQSTTGGIKFPDGITQTTASTISAFETAKVITYTSSGTWTKATDAPANSVIAFIEAWGAGAGGGAGTGGAAIAGGGGGGYTYRYIPIASLAATVTVTVAGNSASNTNGGQSSFGALAIAYGGSQAGAGGSVLSAGSAAVRGYPDGGIVSGNNAAGGGFFGGGGSVATGPGGNALNGGGGGAGAGISGSSYTGGVSQRGGNGGDVTSARGAAGTAPGGGGGANSLDGAGFGGVGARGQVRITMW